MKATIATFDKMLIAAGFTYGIEPGTFHLPRNWNSNQVNECVYEPVKSFKNWPINRVVALAALVRFIEKYETQ